MIVFVCGPSGSGKTTALELANLNSLNIKTVRGSSVLRGAGRPTKKLSVLDTLRNQRVLAATITKLASAHRYLVFDGHLLLRTMEGPFLVPDIYISEMSPCGIIFLTDDANNLSIRERKSLPQASLIELESFSRLEEIHAQRLAMKLGIGFRKISNPEPRKLRLAVMRMMDI